MTAIQSDHSDAATWTRCLMQLGLVSSNELPAAQQADLTAPSLQRRYLGLFILLTLVDGLQTSTIVSQFGSVAEVNPLMRLAIEHFSLHGLWVIKAFSIIAIALAMYRIRPVVLFGSVALMAVVVTSNMLQMLAI